MTKKPTVEEATKALAAMRMATARDERLDAMRERYDTGSLKGYVLGWEQHGLYFLPDVPNAVGVVHAKVFPAKLPRLNGQVQNGADETATWIEVGEAINAALAKQQSVIDFAMECYEEGGRNTCPCCGGKLDPTAEVACADCGWNG